MSHSAAVALLSRPAEEVTLQLLFVPPEGDDASTLADDPFAFKYRMFDDDVVSVASSNGSVLPLRFALPPPATDSLSRASVESIRGSCDNLVAEETFSQESGDIPQVVDDTATEDCDVHRDPSLNAEVELKNSSLSPSRTDDDFANLRTPELCHPVPRSSRSYSLNNESRKIDPRTIPLTSISVPGDQSKLSSSPPTPVHRKLSSSSNAGGNNSRHKTSFSRNVPGTIVVSGDRQETTLRQENRFLLKQSSPTPNSPSFMTPLQELEHKMTTLGVGASCPDDEARREVDDSDTDGNFVFNGNY
ncbi:uncharacterized protein LOC108675913 [Hyalella azteca]|uniref:Uncharacterized protein LOC108675913 n=1 Tax=Hyalella azteca TaxID=294128 RepID=A0A8B7P353_HYAAZ|nr:uncharacterized protein LOC108675913 [Hyalella azteca]